MSLESMNSLNKLCFDVIFAMRQRNRETELGSRPVERFYCPPGSPKVPFNLLPRHTKSTHGAKNLFPPRTNDATPIQDFFAIKNKKPKVEKPVIRDSQGSNSSANDPSWLASLLNVVYTLFVERG